MGFCSILRIFNFGHGLQNSNGSSSNSKVATSDQGYLGDKVAKERKEQLQARPCVPHELKIQRSKAPQVTSCPCIFCHIMYLVITTFKEQCHTIQRKKALMQANMHAFSYFAN